MHGRDDAPGRNGVDAAALVAEASGVHADIEHDKELAEHVGSAGVGRNGQKPVKKLLRLILDAEENLLHALWNGGHQVRGRGRKENHAAIFFQHWIKSVCHIDRAERVDLYDGAAAFLCTEPFHKHGRKPRGVDNVFNSAELCCLLRRREHLRAVGNVRNQIVHVHVLPLERDRRALQRLFLYVAQQQCVTLMTEDIGSGKAHTTRTAGNDSYRFHRRVSFRRYRL